MNSRLVGLVIPLILGVWPSSAMTINHTVGAVFMAETPLIIASAMEMSWVSVPFPVVPAANRTLLDIAFQEHQYMLTERWKEWNGKICGDRLFTEAFVNLTYLAFKGLEYEISEIEAVLHEMRNRAMTFVDKHEESSPRGRRWIKPALGGVAAAIVLAPILKEGFCHYFSFFGLCDGDTSMDILATKRHSWMKLSELLCLSLGRGCTCLGIPSTRPKPS